MSKRIGVLTAGGDCPGLNAVIRAVAKAGFGLNWEVLGFQDGFAGLVEERYMVLRNPEVSGILAQGGTILGTSNTADPFRYPVQKGRKIIFRNYSQKVIHCVRKLNLDALVCIGGDGTLTIAERFLRRGVPIIGIPKTIDNDLSGTDFTFGFDTAVHIATDAVDRLHTTAASHHRVMILEVMGRYAGWIALYAGAAGGADVILIPEIPYRMESICRHVRARAHFGKRFSIIVVAEGARPLGGKRIVERYVKTSSDPIRLGGISRVVGRHIEKITGLETRVSILGHIQRGGTPTADDRNLGTLFGHQAVKLIQSCRIGYMAAFQNGKITAVPIRSAIRKLKLVPKNHLLLLAAQAVGTSFGN